MSSLLQNNITNLQSVLEAINALPEAGTDLPELSNPADASKALSGYEFINGDGEKVTGTIPTKTASNLTASGATVTVPAGYYASQATKFVATATQATPSVSIDSAGKITATATQTAGYVSAGTKTGTKQLTTQAAKTVTPSKSSQTAVAKNVYTTGVVTVAAIPSKYVDNSTVTAVESDVMSGKKYGAAGAVKTGTFSLDTELAQQESLISQIATALQGKASGCASVETCTVEINPNNFILYAISYVGIDDTGEISYKYITPSSSAKQTLTCVCNSNIAMSHNSTSNTIVSYNGTAGFLGELYHKANFDLIQVVAGAGETMFISLTTSGGAID